MFCNSEIKEACSAVKTRRMYTFGKHSKPPPVTLSNAKDRILSGTIAANLQAIIAPVLVVTYQVSFLRQLTQISIDVNSTILL